MLANYHTHTTRCKHAFGSEREYIEAAIKKGYKILGFSDHVPQPYPEGFVSGIRMDMSELSDYTSTLVSLREEYKDRIQILIGYEVEYSHRFFDRMMDELRKYPLDYMILGQHFAPNEVDGFYVGAPTSDEDKLKAYVDLSIEGMKTGLFTYLCHPDLMNYTGDEEKYLRHMRRIVEASIELDFPLEVNVYGFIDGRHYPSDRFFKMASEMGARFVIGCDAHDPRVLINPEDVPEFNEFLKRNKIEYGDNIVDIIRP
ncbi:histidinol-phosphatase HisJ family protein [Butyrivibrio sp. X503]|uniref:histidinol-phosphatase n=1 Tax=Butyrivibrio sp. X503 TaxID=2364878 RepID=UPI000EA96C8E|nr:histidinol-phosphatase [Butyrivibrio sp. X503]RKM58163.1 histidinol-phosphatase HisJ family protein [Butyrivibrio sp. X503]